MMVAQHSCTTEEKKESTTTPSFLKVVWITPHSSYVVGHPDIGCFAQGKDPLRRVLEEEGFFPAEKKTLRSLQLNNDIVLAEIKTDFRRKDKGRQFFVRTTSCLDNDFSVQDNLKAEQPEHRRLHRFAFSHDEDNTISKMIGRRQRRWHRAEEKQAQKSSRQP